MKTYGMEVDIHAFSISTVQGEWSAPKYRSLQPCEKSSVYKTQDWLGSTGYRDVKKGLLKSIIACAVVHFAAYSHYTELRRLRMSPL